MSRIDSQSTTDENDEKDDATEPYTDNPQNEDFDEGGIGTSTEGRISGTKTRRDDCLENWPHDRQPGWSQYSETSQNSQTSRISCSLDVPLTQAEPEPFDAVRHPETSMVLVPETPKSGQTQAKSTKRRVNPTLSKKEAEEQIQHITEYLEQHNYTVFTHKTRIGNYERTMHLGFLMYEDSSHNPSASDDESHQPAST